MQRHASACRDAPAGHALADASLGVQSRALPPHTGGTGSQVPLAAARPQLSLVIWAATSAVLALVGCAGPWVTALFITRAGLDTGDGRLVGALTLLGGIALALHGAGVLRHRAAPVLAAIAGSLSALVAAVDLTGIGSDGGVDFFGSRIQVLQPGWGLYLTLGASISLAIASSLLAKRGPLEGKA